MEDLTALAEDEIAVRIVAIRERESAAYRERTALEQEVRRRASSARGQVLEKVLGSDPFSASVRTEVRLSIRIPDDDWFVDDDDAHSLAGEVGFAFGEMHKFGNDAFVEFRGHKYFAEYTGSRLNLRPWDSKDVAAWTALLEAFAPRLAGDFDTKYSLEGFDVVSPLVREIVARPAPEIPTGE